MYRQQAHIMGKADYPRQREHSHPKETAWSRTSFPYLHQHKEVELHFKPRLDFCPYVSYVTSHN